jgi:ankyrin repeat protein
MAIDSTGCVTKGLDTMSGRKLLFIVVVCLCAMVVLSGASRANDMYDAIKAGDLAKVQSLIEADPSLVNHTGDDAPAPPLNWAATEGQKAIAEYLISKGADVNAKTPSMGQTALHAAVSRRYQEIVQLLLDHGADVNVQEDWGKDTPLSYAVAFPKKEIVEMLLAKGADTEHADVNGLRPLHHAAAHGLLEIATLLLDKGADVNSKTNDGDTPLHFAADMAGIKMVKLLISRGAKIDAKNKVGETAMESAAFRGKKDVALYLFEQAAPQTSS